MTVVDDGSGAVDGQEFLAERFEANRGQLRAVAYRMLGSVSEADDAVQEAWLRLSRTDTTEVGNLAAWLTTVVGRVCLDMLRSRTRRREELLGVHAGGGTGDEVHLPEPIVSGAAGVDDPEQQALLADSVGLALLVVLETLGPAERLAFVLHDMFGVTFDEIAPIVDKTPAAARQLASRARRRVQGAAPAPDADLTRQRQVVEAFLTAARGGSFEALVAVLDPDVVLRADVGAGPFGLAREVRGAEAVAGRALMFRQAAQYSVPALVNGAAGLVAVEDGRPVSVMGFTVVDGLIVAIDILADAERVKHLDLAVLNI